MSTVWSDKPPFPESDLGPGTRRFQIGEFYIDWNQPGEPTQADVDAILNPPPVASAAEIFKAAVSKRLGITEAELTDAADALRELPVSARA
jgi:hypothetical protein